MTVTQLHTASASLRLILIFAGWGQDATPFGPLAVEGYDIAVCHSYTAARPDWETMLRGYGEIVVVAWSYGLGPAAEFISSHPGLPLTARIAVNSTPWPVHPTLGIPPELFEATLRGLDARAKRKFDMRMCGGARAYALYEPMAPRREVGGLREELLYLTSTPWPRVRWDVGVVQTEDAIIPPDAQRRAWATEAARTIVLPGPHLPDFGRLLGDMLTRKELVAERFAGAVTTYDGEATVQAGIVSRLIGLIPVDAFGGRVLEIGSGTGMATTELAARPYTALEAWDLHITPAVASIPAIIARDCDAETEIFKLADGSVDLLVSASAVQWFNSLPAFLREVARVLSPGGTAAISTYGPATMGEMHAALGTRSRYPATEELLGMFPPGLVAADVREETMTITFDTPRDVLRHMRLTGVNALGSGPSAVAAARTLLESYPLAPDGTAPLTYQPIYLLLRKPL